MTWKNTTGIQFVKAEDISAILNANIPDLISLVGETYESFYADKSINPDTYSLKFKEKKDSRINALPAYVSDPVNMAGIKWVASFPKNVTQNKQRASAIIILNSYETGYPLAVLDGSLISAARTAASAALAARCLRPSKEIKYMCLYGAGVINRITLNFLLGDGWDINKAAIVDVSDETKTKFMESFSNRGIEFVERELRESPDMISFATSALTPWYDKEVTKDQILLHISLRDIMPGRLKEVDNFVDDVDHALKANTSLHLLEQSHGRTFSINNYSTLINKTGSKNEGGVVSAFGMGILDVAFSVFVLDKAEKLGLVNTIEGLSASRDRWVE